MGSNPVHRYPYVFDDGEWEKASNSYLMSLTAVLAGLPLPVVNLLASLFYYLGNQHSSYFVRWHCLQALLANTCLLPFNTLGFWWCIRIVFGGERLSNGFVGYLICLLLANFIEFVATIHAAIATRKGRPVRWFFFADLTDALCRR